jgi:hypothetical protein
MSPSGHFMKFVSTLSEEEIEQLKKAQLYHASPRTRIRASVILLSNARIPLQQIAPALSFARQTVSLLIDECEKTRTIAALEDLPRCGAPPLLSSQEEDLLLQLVKQEPRNQKKVLHLFKEKNGKTASPTPFKQDLL